MKAQKHLRQLVALVLSFVMVFSGPGRVLAEGITIDQTGDGKNTSGLEYLDPSTLHVKKLGKTVKDTAVELDDPDEIYGPDDMVRVSILMETPSALDAGYVIGENGLSKGAQNYRTRLKGTQSAVQQRIQNKLSKAIDVKWNLTLAVNAVSANVRYGDIEAIKSTYGVKDVVLENRYESQAADTNTSNTSSGMVGATDAWAAGYTGAGSKIAIIDSGLDLTHISFDSEAFDYSIAELEANGATVDLMTEVPADADLNVPGEYFNSKVPFGYNYVDGDLNISHIYDRGSDHGTHVSGIAAGNKYIKKADGSFAPAAEEVFAVGMAPDAQLFVMKVFSNVGAYDSDYMAAIEDALVLGADAINLSLGSSAPGFTYTTSYQDTFNKLSGSQDIKAVVTISAGNNGAFTDQTLAGDLFIEDVSQHTGGSPGTYINSLGVASADNIGTTGMPLVYNGKSIFYGETDSTGAKIKTIGGTWDFVYIDGVGKAEEYAAVNEVIPLAGKIIITNRGELSFYEKGNNAIQFDPKAVIVANNAAGMINMLLDDYTGTFPMVSISLADANMIKESAASGTAGNYTYYTGSIEVKDSISADITSSRDEATISSFSSWGVPGSLVMKPEITAPGGSIYSANGNHLDENGNPAGGSDKYISYSGTSMAAPHMAGLAAVVAQYLRENPIADGNEELAAKYSTRAIVQSLLMSTATPMFDAKGSYYPILQQGAGLADVNAAINAASVIMVGEEDGTLTALLGSAADGKVKAEFGDDPERIGEYTYSFTIYNTSDSDLEYELATDLFTQYLYASFYPDILSESDDPQSEEYYNIGLFMDRATADLAADVSYDWEAKDTPYSHDVDKDGDTDDQDAQAILDYLTGERDGAELDLEAGEMDEDGELTTYDAYLLLTWENPGYPDEAVIAHDSRQVTVTINLDPEDMADLDSYYENGAYVEGFTYATASGKTEDGADLSHEHTIPLLGFYGNWSDPSMFDNTSLIDRLYGSYKLNYSLTDQAPNNYYTNYLTVNYDGEEVEFTGNPYMVEESFPADKLALNSSTKLGKFYYNLIRSAGTMGYAASILDEPGGEILGFLDASIENINVDSLYYHENLAEWQNAVPRTYRINHDAAYYGLEEGDVFRVGYYAIPEYYGIIVNNLMPEGDLLDGYAGTITDTNLFASVIYSEMLGKGSFLGFDFTLDDTAPEISKAELNEGKISVEITDNENIAYVVLMSLDGEMLYSEEVAPGAGEYTADIDAAQAIEEAEGYVAVFAADYAGNETAVAVQVNENGGDIDPYAVASITVKPTELDLYKGDTAVLQATIMPMTVEDRTVTWTSSDETVATVDESGVVTAVGVGTATITATSNQDSTKTFDVPVRVIVINKELNAVIWDEEGQIFFSNFNTNNLPTWKRLHEDSKLPTLIHSAFMADDNTLYAGTLDTSSAESVFYKVNREDYSLEETGKNYVWAGDTAIGIADPYFGDWVGMVYTFGYRLIAGNYIAMDDEGIATTGLPYAVGDFSSVNGGAYLAGVANVYNDPENAESAYWVVDENGDIWETWLYYEMGEGFVFSEPELVTSTGIDTDFVYQSLYADGQYLYWSHFDRSKNVSELIIIDMDTLVIYHAGDFGDGVWPAAGLYVDGKVAPASIEVPSEIESVYPADGVKKLIDPESIQSEEFDVRLAESLNKIRNHVTEDEGAETIADVEEVPEETVEEIVTEAAEEAAEEVVTEATEEVAEEVTEEAIVEAVEEEAVVEAVEEEAAVEAVNEVTGGLNVIRNYVPAKVVKRDDAGETIDIDEEEAAEDEYEFVLEETTELTNGLYTINYDPAALQYLDSDSELKYKSIHVDEENGKIVFAFANETAIPAGDELAIVTFEEDCEESTVTVVANERGAAVSLDEETEEVVPGAGHEWEFTDFTWNDDHTAEANFTCKVDEEHTMSVEAEVSETIVDPTTEKAGTATYEAVAEFEGKTYTDTLVETIDKVTYEFTKGANGTWDATANAGETYDIQVKRSYKDETTFSLFKELKMDGAVIDPKNYTAKAGSLDASLSAEYMESLLEGEHVLSVVFNDATVDTKITVKAAETPSTGDPNNAMPWVMLMMSALLGGIAVIFFSKEKEWTK